MIQYIQNQEIDYVKWDNCIAHAYNGNLYAWSWYLDIVCEGWDALVLGDYEHVMPLTYGRKYGIGYLYQPPFTQQLGVFSKVPGDSLPVNDFLQSLGNHYRFAEINMNRYNKISHPGFKVSMRRNYELDLIKNYDELRKSYASNTSRNIKKAEKEGIDVVTNADPGDIIGIFKNEKGKELKKLGDRQYQMLEKLMYRGTYKKMAMITGAYDKNNQLCAGAFLIESHQRLVFLFSANNAAARQTGAMHLLVDWVIRKFSGKPITLDFEGSEIPGLARFYAGFGSQETLYPALYYNKLPFQVKLIMQVLHNVGLK
jgi:hypothetical protein